MANTAFYKEQMVPDFLKEYNVTVGNKLMDKLQMKLADKALRNLKVCIHSAVHELIDYEVYHRYT